MSSGNRTVFALASIGIALIAIAEAGAADPPAGIRPARVEAISGSPIKKITLTQKAAERIDVQTKPVRDVSGKKVVPYAAVIYDKDGSTWLYTNPQPLTYIRHSIVVELIQGDDAVLKEGPAVGVVVTTTGTPQLYGAEKGVGH